MTANLDVDLLKTFKALAETGSFTRAAGEVGRTQSAVSMQMRRLEEIAGRPLIARDGKVNRLTPDGVTMLDYARRIIRLNDEAVMSFNRPELVGRVRLGTPDDYADRVLPEVLARFARTHPQIQVDVECLSSPSLGGLVAARELDLALVSCTPDIDPQRVEIVRSERLLWVTSSRHDVHREAVLPVALSHAGCSWRQLALDALEQAGRRYRIAYASANSIAISAAVLADLAVAAIPAIVLRPGMRVLGAGDGLPGLGTFDIGLIRSSDISSAGEALARHLADAVGQTVGIAVAAE